MDETVRSGTHAFPVQTVRVTLVGPSDRTDPAPSAEAEAVTIGTADGNQLVLVDPMVSRYHLEAIATLRGIRLHDLGSTNGTFVGALRVHDAEIPSGTVARAGNTLLFIQAGSGDAIALHPESTFHGLVGSSPSMRRLFSQIERAAASNVAVLLAGESGTGKEVVAGALHEASARAAGPLVVVDCGALVPTLVASELFGHERGAFTGADRQHLGAFERASGGTLLLDEIGELPSGIQPALLGALERKRVRRVGGKIDIPVDVRIVAASHRDLRGEVNAGRFRLDLFYRLAVITLVVPALRERLSDLPSLIEHFARSAGFNGRMSELVSPSALAALNEMRFDGNLRELRNLVEALLTMGELPSVSRASSGSPHQDDDPTSVPYREARAAVLLQFEATYVEALLRRANGNVAAAARHAGMDRSYLSGIVSRLRLKRSDP